MTAEAERPLPCPLPCPFCGAKMVPQDGWELVGIELFVHSDAPSGDREPCIHSDTLLDLDEIAAWNRRAPDAQVRPVGDEALDEMERLSRAAEIALSTTMPVPAWVATMDAFRDAANPAVVLALVAQVRALTAERDRLRAAISADRAPFLALRVERRINEELGGDATAGWIAEMTLEEIRRNLDEPARAALGAP